MRNDKRVEIINFLKKNTNQENACNIDQINEQIYRVENREVELEYDRKKYDEKTKTKKRGEHRNANRKTTRDNLSKLVEMGFVRCIERPSCEIHEGTSCEKIIFSLDDIGKDWFSDWKFYYNQPISLTHLIALSECVMQLDATWPEIKKELIETLASCAGENLVEEYKKSLSETNPDYLSIIREYKNTGVQENKSFLASEWTKGEIAYDSFDIVENLELIYSKFLLQGKAHKKMRFKLFQFDSYGNREAIGQDRIYTCFPLYIITADKRFWLVSIMDTDNTEWHYYENLNFAPIDRMGCIEECECEEFSLSDYKKVLLSKDDIYKVATEHHIAGSFFSYEEPAYAVIKVKYSERIKAIPFDLIYRSFGEDFYYDENKSNDQMARIMVKRSPYSVKQWAKVNDEFIEIEGFYDEKGCVQ